MSKAIENLEGAQQRAMAGRPKVGGFPYLAETLRRAGVTRNHWFLPACQSLYITQGSDRSWSRALRCYRAPRMCHHSTVKRSLQRCERTRLARAPSLSFCSASWRAGVVSYDVDCAARTCTYYGSAGEKAYLKNTSPYRSPDHGSVCGWFPISTLIEGDSHRRGLRAVSLG